MPGPTFEFEQDLLPESCSTYAGVDEAGRGALCGPVVAAAVSFSHPVEIPFLNDSKKLSASQREKIFAALTQCPHARIGIGIIDHTTIDRVNILQATKLAMNQAVSQITPPPGCLLVDGMYLDTSEIVSVRVVKGDALCSSIAAASVIAKVTRDRIMLELDDKYPHYALARNKGYGTPDHLEAIGQHGISDVHRRSYQPCAQLPLF